MYQTIDIIGLRNKRRRPFREQEMVYLKDGIYLITMPLKFYGQRVADFLKTFKVSLKFVFYFSRESAVVPSGALMTLLLLDYLN